MKNFRCFEQPETIVFNKGLTVLVGENDSGKSAIIDAIRIVLGTTDQSWYHIELSDFYKENRETEICIVLKFTDLSQDEQAAFLECLSYENEGPNNIPCLYIHWSCKYLLNFMPPRATTSISTGQNGDGPALPSAAKELLRVTYLRPLLDDLSRYASIEEKAAFLYSFFADESTSKAEVAQQMAYIIETTYKTKPEILLDKLPIYIKDAIKYVTEG